jgi:immune inhibitor A
VRLRLASAIRPAAATLAAAAAWLVLTGGAAATVHPPDEWFDCQAKYDLWQQMWPALNDWEFTQQPARTGDPLDSRDGIQRYLGQPDANVGRQMRAADPETGPYSYDLNMDGQVDQFDLLELGYQVLPARKQASTAPSKGTNKWVVLRADFQDQSANYGTYTQAYFNDRFFSDGTAAKPSINDFYSEVSYDELSITGIVPNIGPGGDGWCKGEHTKQWYINNGGWWLVREAVLAADATVDFSQYDVDHDGYADTVLLYYPNMVFSGGLWPHRSSGLNIHVDGVIVDSYFLSGYDTANDSYTMVVSAHEYGHILGLPDLYDTDYSSNGCGKWSLMAYNYDNGQKPPSPDPWCKIQLGWATPTVITDNVAGCSLGCYQDGPEVLKVWTDGKHEDQYFLVANYRQKGTDANRPGQGLLVEHIDDSRGGSNSDNSNEYRKHVDIESARGQNDPNSSTARDPLDQRTDQGHANDPWFSGNSAAAYTGVFDENSNPNTKKYPHPYTATYVKLSNISASSDSMTLDIDVVSPNAPTVVIDSPAGGVVSGNVEVDVTATPGDGRSIDRVLFYCNGAYLGQDTSAPYSLTFDSRCIYNGARDIAVAARDDQGAIDTASVTVTVDNAGASVPYSDGFESGIGAWAVYDPSGNQYWQQKSIAYGGSKSAGIGGSSGYDYDEHDSFACVRLAVSGTHPLARFVNRHNVSAGENTCKVLVTADDGATFTNLATYTGNSLSWHPGAVSLDDYAGQDVYIVFKLEGSSLNAISGTEGGWWIDNFEVKERSDPPQITSITPGDGSTLSGVSTITVTATDDEGVVNVDFYLNGALAGSDFSAPFTFDWNSDWVFNGSHTFMAKAYDADMQNDSDSVAWTTNNAGLSIPWGETFASDPGSAWHMIDETGAGYWHLKPTGGYGGGQGMYMGINTYYDDGESDWLISPTLYISGVTKPGFGWLHRYDIEANYDYAHVYVTTDLNTWTQLALYSATNQPWQSGGARLDGYNGQRVKLAFYFESDGGVVKEGWYTDELRVDPAPQIAGVSPSRRRVGQQFTISGSGFGGGAASDFPRVTVNGVTASTSAWSDTSITATVPSGASSGNVIVYRHGIPSDGASLTVILAAPALQNLDQM